MKEDIKIQRLAAKINEDNEDVYIFGLREYYRQNFKNGISEESFLVWLQGKLGFFDDEEERHDS